MSVPTVQVGIGAGGDGGATVLTTIVESADTLPTSPPIDLPRIDNPNSPRQQSYVNLASGDNTIYLPEETGFIVILPPVATSTPTITLKGITGDTGWVLLANGAPIGPLPFPNPPPASLILTASGAINGVRILFF